MINLHQLRSQVFCFLSCLCYCSIWLISAARLCASGSDAHCQKQHSAQHFNITSKCSHTLLSGKVWINLRVVSLQAVRLCRPLRAAGHLWTSTGTTQQWGACLPLVAWLLLQHIITFSRISQYFFFSACSLTTLWGRWITSSVSWWTVWSRWICIAVWMSLS